MIILKKWLNILLFSSILLAACSNEEPAVENKNTQPQDEQVSQQIEKKEQKNDPENNVPSPAPEQAQQAIDKIVEDAKKDDILKEASVKETEESVSVNLQFDEKATDEEKAQVLINYQILMQAKHPEQKIDINIVEN